MEEVVRYSYRLRPGRGAQSALLAEWHRCRFLWNEAVHQQKSGSRPTFGTLSKLLTAACVDSVVDGGDHYIVIGRVLALSESIISGRPLLFCRGQYTAIEPDKTVPAPWRHDLDHFLTTTTRDTWL